MREGNERKESIFRQSVDAEKNKADLLEKKFAEALRKAKDAPKKSPCASSTSTEPSTRGVFLRLILRPGFADCFAFPALSRDTQYTVPVPGRQQSASARSHDGGCSSCQARKAIRACP